MRWTIALPLVAVSIAGCGKMSTPHNPNATPQVKTGVVEHPAEPNNTATNERDFGSTAKTPIDQNEDKFDINITADIRKRVMDAEMSVDAHNVKIITQDGRVTLRGPVKSAGEKKRIEDIANDVAGPNNVETHIEIESDQPSTP